MRIGVTGNNPLKGTYHPGGSSNAALALIAASLLSEQPVTLGNLPGTASVELMLEVAALLGTEAAHNPAARSVRLTTPAITTRALTRAMTAQKVGVVLFLAPILARRGHVRLEVTYPVSRLYPHLTALRDLGCRVDVREGLVEVALVPWQRREVVLMQTSVTATAMVAMLAAAQPGETIVHNAASEPHVRDLLDLLVTLGAQIDGIGSNLLRITGRESLGGGAATIAPDHVEIASVAAIAALSGGRLDVEGVRAPDLRLIARVFGRLGLRLDLDDDHLHVPRHEGFIISGQEEEVDVSVETAPWPGFPSDLVGMATLIATQAQGTILVHEKLFKDRMLFVDKLTGFGAQIVLCDPHRAVVVGPTPLYAQYLDTPDVRTGLALLGAALLAEGETIIDGAELLDWNFDGVLPKLSALGASIRVLER
ncbi:MAG: UDP-N-acetylglucosamine 1-carboxyvinyltransferase [Anaerolineae bacterium]|nr:UDP-N-acetylglucosamine 1-carboxyvinyltransferase [Anaerolineae bacterium]